ncbi:hypothetical protein [Prescottella equi]|uniref:Uncharacterized protein n=1 Tax=Rhodococcus phage REQ3 TaxID=1109714 RepID=G9FHA4_9CAUD|nr:hypothetical protein [Prescottella equi]YP_005087249.1 tail protein [Rhodococcus phage REQ3]AEV51993.1 hypothetical protein [Rhodococcus phage REQ3]ERN43232.1 hypothetical protein H849_24224 [Prescottella equi NBRC 101255 = C 7]ORL29084.1 hypothetical protein A6I89_02015 [Prescottella equi]QPQ77252.1 hypothetical protein I6H09_24375 [Prescottella equi]SUE04899.1 Uncharacterised protein [Prescottella equi]
MTILTGTVRDIGAYDDLTVFKFATPVVREDDSGDGIITTRKVRCQANAGVLTTPDLEPGIAILTIQGDPHPYQITVPDSPTPVQLWPLIQAATPPDPGSWTTGYISNAGGIARAQAVPLTAYPGMVKDPETFYVIFE